MTKDVFIQKVKSLNLTIGSYVIFGSGPLSIRELCESNDIDILLQESVWNKYKDRSEWTLGISKFKSDYFHFDNIELFKDWKPGDWDVKYLIESADIISGLPFVNLKEVIKWKEILRRDKDLKDIELINSLHIDNI